MSKEYLHAIQKKEKYKKENQIYLKNRVFKTFKNLIKTFYNTELKKNHFADLGSADGALSMYQKKD